MNRELFNDDRLPLTAGQRGIWVGQQIDPQSTLYNAAECVELRDSCDVAVLEEAIRRTVSECDALQVRFARGADGITAYQVRERQRSFSLERVDVSHQADPRAAAREWMHDDIGAMMDLEAGHISRHALIDAGREGLLWYHCAHHIALDGFGFALIAKRVAALYGAKMAGRPPSASSFGQLRSVLEQERGYSDSYDYESDREFWRDYVSRAGDVPSFSDCTARASSAAVRETTALPSAVKRSLEAVARSVHATWMDAVVAGLAAYLSRRRGASEVVLGLPVMCRSGASLRVPCMVMNIVPLRVPVLPGESFRDIVFRARQAVRHVLPRARYRYEDMRCDLARSGQRLFGPVVNVMPFDHGFWFGKEYAIADNISAGPVEDLAVAVYAHADGRAPRIDFDANPVLYDQLVVRRLLEDFVHFLEEASRDPEATVASNATAGSAYAGPEVATVLEGPALGAPARDAVERIVSRALAEPDRRAVEDGAQHRTYGELLRDAERVASALRRRGAAAETLVAVAMPRSIEAVAAIVGTLLAGAAYVPLDDKGPSARTAFILEDSKPMCVVTTRRGAETMALPVTADVLLWDELDATDGAGPSATPSEDTLAYAIYTSGSTGKPNGVLVERGALSHFVAAALDRYGFRDTDRVLQFAPLHFDASVEEIFVTLAAGATLVLRDEDMLESLSRFTEECRRRAITVLDLPTAFWHELTYALAETGVKLPENVRAVIIGGETASPARVVQWHERVKRTTRLFNTYGPTEVTVVATCVLLQDCDLDGEPIPIGTPLPGVRALVMGPDGMPASTGAAGELYLMGPTLARGYLRRPRAQEERFVTLSRLPGQPRAYRTGDRVRRRDDGELVFLGRVDDEVKISGHRVDLREVENRLLSFPGVREAAVIAVDVAGGKALVAHIAEAEPSTLAPSALRSHSAGFLLAPAVPSMFVMCESLPRTASGKIDRAALRDVSKHVENGRRIYPVTALERTLVDLWQQVLGRRDLSTEDDFFARGGQSLQAIQLANRLTAHLKRDVPAILLFRHPTIRELASALDGGSRQGDCASAEISINADAVLPADVRPPSHQLAPWPPRRVLITGATGFVGSHLLAELLLRTKCDVVCVVRASDHAEASVRVRKALDRACSSPIDFSRRVDVLAGDISKSRFGLDASRYADLARSCDAVVHSAATVSVVRNYASVRPTNVLGTLELIRFATVGRIKGLHHVSTIAAAMRARDATVPEAFVESPPPFQDGYAQSKWVAERLLCQAKKRGLDVSVYRLGRVVGPLETGYVNPSDLVWRMLKLGVSAKVVPDFDLAEPWTPVDFVARALVALSLTRPRGLVYNLVPKKFVCLADVFEWVNDYGYDFERCSLREWRDRLRDCVRDEDAPVLAFFDAMVEQEPGRASSMNAVVRGSRTRRELAEHGLECASFGRQSLYRYLDYCIRTGFLPSTASARAGACSNSNGETRQ